MGKAHRRVVVRRGTPPKRQTWPSGGCPKCGGRKLTVMEPDEGFPWRVWGCEARGCRHVWYHDGKPVRTVLTEAGKRARACSG